MKTWQRRMRGQVIGSLLAVMMMGGGGDAAEGTEGVWSAELADDFLRNTEGIDRAKVWFMEKDVMTFRMEMTRGERTSVLLFNQKEYREILIFDTGDTAARTVRDVMPLMWLSQTRRGARKGGNGEASESLEGFRCRVSSATMGENMIVKEWISVDHGLVIKRITTFGAREGIVAGRQAVQALRGLTLQHLDRKAVEDLFRLPKGMSFNNP